jgi:hypothetical protein
MPYQRRTVTGVILLSAVLLCLAGQAIALQPGDKAPDFALPGTTAEHISLRQYLGHKHVVIFFYITAFGGA